MIIRRLESEEERRRCAEMMSESEPWITLGRDYESSLRVLANPDVEIYLATRQGEIDGFLVLNMRVGPFRGYIQTICVAPESRGRGVGTALIGHAEERVFAESPNVFLCVSDFNPRARTLYERLGYRFVGELTDFVVKGRSEYLLRKTRGP